MEVTYHQDENFEIRCTTKPIANRVVSAECNGLGMFDESAKSFGFGF